MQNTGGTIQISEVSGWFLFVASSMATILID
jgi:hypothetical protein